MLLGQSRSQGLCHSCRYDLLRLFEHGFAHPVPNRRPPLPHPRTPKVAHRTISYYKAKFLAPEGEQERSEHTILDVGRWNDGLFVEQEAPELGISGMRLRKRASSTVISCGTASSLIRAGPTVAQRLRRGRRSRTSSVSRRTYVQALLQEEPSTQKNDPNSESHNQAKVLSNLEQSYPGNSIATESGGRLDAEAQAVAGKKDEGSKNGTEDFISELQDALDSLDTDTSDILFARELPQLLQKLESLRERLEKADKISASAAQAARHADENARLARLLVMSTTDRTAAISSKVVRISLNLVRMMKHEKELLQRGSEREASIAEWTKQQAEVLEQQHGSKDETGLLAEALEKNEADLFGSGAEIPTDQVDSPNSIRGNSPRTESSSPFRKPVIPLGGLVIPARKRAYHSRRQLPSGTQLENPETQLDQAEMGLEDMETRVDEAEPWMEDPEKRLVESQDKIVLLRSNEASKDDIVREARQIHGEALPEGILTEEEFTHYLRLYGEPAKEVKERKPREQKSEQADARSSDELVANGEHELLRENGEIVDRGMGVDDVDQDANFGADILDYESADTDLPSQPQTLLDVSHAVGGAVYNREYNPIEDEEDDRIDERAHPLTILGRFATSPRTVFLPQESVVKPVERFLSEFSNKHLKEMCEKTFGGQGLPDSPLTPYTSSARQRQQVPIPLDAAQPLMGEMEANSYLTAVMPPVYASILSVLTETRKRLGASWLRSLILKEGGPRILDAGAAGAGILAWNQIVEAEWASLHGDDAASARPAPSPKAVVLTGSDTLRHRASMLLENTTFVPRLPDYVHTRDIPTLEDSRAPQQRKEFDVVIASHTLFPLKEDYLRKQHVQNLWSLLSPSGGVLILLEKGVPRGFEAVAGARKLLLERYIASPGSDEYESPLSNSLAQEEQVTKKEKGMIIAPCTNHEKCPMYSIPGVAEGRRDYCAFQQRFIRPTYLQRVMEGSHWNDEDVKFSYLAVLKGEDLRGTVEGQKWKDLVNPMEVKKERSPATSDLLEASTEGFEVHARSQDEAKEATASEMQQTLNAALPRLVFPPLKRKGHVTLDVCTPWGKIERWTVPKSFSKQAYRDARKSKWGDLWGLGAKTQIERNLRCGTSGTKEGRKMERKKRKVAERDEERREASETEALGRIEGEKAEAAERKARARMMVSEAVSGQVDEEEEEDEDVFGFDEEDFDDLEDDDEDDDIFDQLAAETAAQARSSTRNGFPLERSRRALPDKKLERLASQLGTSPRPQSGADEVEVDARLKEWEKEYEVDRNVTKIRDGRRREGRDKRRGPRK